MTGQNKSTREMLASRLAEVADTAWADANILLKTLSALFASGPFDNDEGGYFEDRLEIVADILAPEHGRGFAARSSIFELIYPRTPVVELREALVRLNPDLDAENLAPAKIAIDDWLRSALAVMSSTKWRGVPDETRHILDQLVRKWRTVFEHITAVDPPTPDELIRHRMRQTDDSYAAIENLRAEAVEALRATQSATGQTGDTVLGSFFAEDAKNDAEVATKLSFASGGSLVLALCAGIWIAIGVHEITLPLVAAKLSVSLPLLGLSIYLGRLASHYRDAARWARTAAVQLKSVEPYVSGFAAPEGREEVRLVLGRRVFGDPGFSKSPKNMDTEDAVSIIDAIGRLPKGS